MLQCARRSTKVILEYIHTQRSMDRVSQAMNFRGYPARGIESPSNLDFW